MIKEIRLPELSESISSADVVKVLVAVGDVVRVDQPLLELETEKAMFELPSPEKGAVVEILVRAGEAIKVGQVLMTVDVSGEARAPRPEPPQKASPAAAPPAPQPPPPAPEPAGPRAEEAPAEPAQAEPLPARPAAPASPTVRKLARELGVDIQKVPGTGPRGRISLDDVKTHAKALLAARAQAAGALAVKPLPDFSRWGAVRREPMSKVRKITAESMAHAWATVPQVTQYDRADITDLETFRKRYGQKVGKLTVTAVLLKVVATALKAFPRFNASVDTAAGELVYKEFVDVGVAVDTDRGLLVPVVRHADRKNIQALSVELHELAEKCRSKRITPEELEGGNFTISNLGGIGGTGFSPIVYWPQVAILGVSRSDMQPVWGDGGFQPRLVLPLSLSYDHRVIDGADAARFLRWVCHALEEPLMLALEG